MLSHDARVGSAEWIGRRVDVRSYARANAEVGAQLVDELHRSDRVVAELVKI